MNSERIKMHISPTIGKPLLFFSQLILFGILAMSDISLLAGNKFETIGGGVSGSTPIKLESLRPIAIGFGAFFLACGLLSLLPMGHKNALTMNYSNWKVSAGAFLILSFLSFAFVVFT